MNYKKLVCPIITPKDFNDTDALVNFVVSDGDGPDYLYLFSQVGEFQYLSKEQRKKFSKKVLSSVAKLGSNHAARKPKVVINVTGNQNQRSSAVDDAIELAKDAEKIGADAVVINPTFMNTTNHLLGPRMSRRGVTEIVRQVIRATDHIDIWIHNQPCLTQDKSVRTETIKKLAREPRIKVIMDQSCDAKRVKNYHDAIDGLCDLYSGSPLPVGCDHLVQGVMAIDANILPAAWRRATVVFNEGDIKGNYLRKMLSDISDSYINDRTSPLKIILKKHGILSCDESWDQAKKIDDSIRNKLAELYENNKFLNLISKGRVAC